MVQNDTIVRYDTTRHSRLELTKNTYKLDIPKIGRKKLVYIPSDSTTIIYRDSIRYVTLPREYYYTSVKDVEIWYSGVDPQIDSVNVFGISKVITHTINNVSKNKIGIGIEASYIGSASIPIYLEYSYLLQRNVEFSAMLLYDLPSQKMGFGLGAKVSFGW